MGSRTGRAWSSVRERMQAFCYWLGPTYCILTGAFILFGSFIIQLLTSIGVPYIKAFDFFRFDLVNSTFIELGMWAACNGRKAFSIPTIGYNEPEKFNCPPAAWGWRDLQYQGITDAFFDHNLPKALILHPISCCFTFFAMVTALVTMKRQRSHFLLPIFSFLSCLFALLSFVIDLATFVPARGKLMGPKGKQVLGIEVLSTELGPAFWLSMCCFILDIIGNSIIIAGYGIWRYQRISRDQRRISGAYRDDIEMKAGSRLSGRRYFANDSVVSLGNHSPYADKDDQDSVDVLAKTRDSQTSLDNSGRQVRNEIMSGASPTHDREDERDSQQDFDEFVDDDDDDDDNNEHDVDVDENGYDSAVSNYDDARSEVGARSSREASRSQVALQDVQGQEQKRTSKSVRRKPVDRQL